jgi:hypothetical protein
MNTGPMPRPRLRALHPLIDDDGACSLIYDLERAAVLEVPEELQLHVASALETTGDLDDGLLSWLVQEDLYTMEVWEGWYPDDEPAGDMWNLGMPLHPEGEAHVRIVDRTAEAAHRALDVAFRQGLGASRVQLHLDWNGAFPGTGLLEQVVFEAFRQAEQTGKEISFDLTLDPAQVTPEAASYISALPLHVRLRCGQFPAGEEALLAPGIGSALFLLWMKELASRVTLSFTLRSKARLKDLLGWARRAGVRHLDAVRLPGGGQTEEEAAFLRDYRADLLAAVEKIVAGLADGDREPFIDFRPLTRAVRRLLHAERRARFREERFAGWPVGDVAFPGPDGVLGMAKGWPDTGAETEDGTEKVGSCRACGARYLCRNSALLIAESAAKKRTSETCAVWIAESEAALRLYHRLAQVDPLQVLAAFGESSDLPDELPAPRVAELWQLKAPF